MTARRPAAPGMPLDEVATPSLLIDLEAFESNLAVMAKAIATHGIRLRPHAKTHKSPIITRLQMAQGAIGACCQTVAEAEALVVNFLLRDARLSVRRGGRVVVVHDGDEHLVCQSLLE